MVSPIWYSIYSTIQPRCRSLARPTPLAKGSLQSLTLGDPPLSVTAAVKLHVRYEPSPPPGGLIGRCSGTRANALAFEHRGQMDGEWGRARQLPVPGGFDIRLERLTIKRRRQRGWRGLDRTSRTHRQSAGLGTGILIPHLPKMSFRQARAYRRVLPLSTGSAACRVFAAGYHPR